MSSSEETSYKEMTSQNHQLTNMRMNHKYLSLAITILNHRFQESTSWISKQLPLRISLTNSNCHNKYSSKIQTLKIVLELPRIIQELIKKWSLSLDNNKLRSIKIQHHSWIFKKSLKSWETLMIYLLTLKER